MSTVEKTSLDQIEILQSVRLDENDQEYIHTDIQVREIKYLEDDGKPDPSSGEYHRYTIMHGQPIPEEIQTLIQGEK